MGDPVTFKPYICNMDSIGCITEPVDYVAGGKCKVQLLGMCETLWEPKMKPDQLFECISQAVMNAMDRDAISGSGAVVHIIEKDKVTTRTLKTRNEQYKHQNVKQTYKSCEIKSIAGVKEQRVRLKGKEQLKVKVAKPQRRAWTP